MRGILSDVMRVAEGRKWLLRGLVLVVVFAGAVSMGLPRVAGWGFFILCFVVAFVASLGVVWAKGRAGEVVGTPLKVFLFWLVVLVLGVVLWQFVKP